MVPSPWFLRFKIFAIRLFKKSIKRHSSLSFKSFWFNLYISPLCHILSKALEMHRNTPLTSMSLSKEVKISWIINRIQFPQNSQGINLEHFGEIRLLAKKYFNVIVYDTFVNLSVDWKRRDWTIVFYVLFVAFFKYRYNAFFFPIIRKCFTFSIL